MRRSASSSCFRGAPRRGRLLLAACLMGAVLPAWPEAPRCDAATCPPLQLRLEEGFDVSRQPVAPAPSAVAPVAEQPSQTVQSSPAVAPPLSPWLAGALALAAGMLLQGIIQGLLRRRRMAAVEPAVVAAPIPARASSLELDEPEVAPVVALGVDAPAPEISLAPAVSVEAPSAVLDLAEAQTGRQEESEAAPALFELEPLDAETPAPTAEVDESPAVAIASEAWAEPEVPEVVTTVEWSVAEAQPVSLEEPQDAPVMFELEPLDAEVLAPTAEVDESPAVAIASEALADSEVPEIAPAALVEPEAPERIGEAWAAIDAPLDFTLEPQFLGVTGEAPTPPAAVEPEAAPLEAVAEAPVVETAEDEAFAVVAEETGGIDSPVYATSPEAVSAEAAATPPATALHGEAQRLETVALLRRLSAQRARGLHPEERLASVFRRISSGRTEAADKSLRELEAFCREGEEDFPPELMTTRQYIVRGRDYELGQRIDSLRARTQDEAAGRRLAVASAFLQRKRFDAVAEVLDELESDLSQEIEIL